MSARPHTHSDKNGNPLFWTLWGWEGIIFHQYKHQKKLKNFNVKAGSMSGGGMCKKTMYAKKA